MYADRAAAACAFWHCLRHQEPVSVTFLAVRHLYDTCSMRRGNKRARVPGRPRLCAAAAVSSGSARKRLANSFTRARLCLCLCRCFFFPLALHCADLEGYCSVFAIKLLHMRIFSKTWFARSPQSAVKLNASSLCIPEREILTSL